MTENTARPSDFLILIADDDEGCREVLRELVEGVGYRALLASSGEEAIDMVTDAEVHLALLDMHLPRLTGLETLQLVRQMHAMLPAILVTADASQSLMREAQPVARGYQLRRQPAARRRRRARREPSPRGAGGGLGANRLVHA